MSTNFYLHCKHSCSACGREFPTLHIGKSSAGWCFALHVEPTQPDHPQSLEDWDKLFCDDRYVIKNEFGAEIDYATMMNIIKNRKGGKRILLLHESWEAFHAQNNSEFGPHDLLRSRIGDHCVAHGETWDLIQGEFS